MVEILVFFSFPGVWTMEMQKSGSEQRFSYSRSFSYVMSDLAGCRFQAGDSAFEMQVSCCTSASRLATLKPDRQPHQLPAIGRSLSISVGQNGFKQPGPGPFRVVVRTIEWFEHVCQKGVAQLCYASFPGRPGLRAICVQSDTHIYIYIIYVYIYIYI